MNWARKAEPLKLTTRTEAFAVAWAERRAARKLHEGLLREVVAIVNGWGRRESALTSGLSEQTIETYRKRLYQVLDVDGATGLMSLLLKAAVEEERP